MVLSPYLCEIGLKELLVLWYIYYYYLKCYCHHFLPINILVLFERYLKRKLDSTKFISIGQPILILLSILYLKLWRHTKDPLIEKTYKKGVFAILISNFSLISSKIPVNVRYYYTKNVSRIYFFKRKGNWLFLGIFFHKSSLLMTPCYDVKISGKECFIKLEWVVQLR